MRQNYSSSRSRNPQTSAGLPKTPAGLGDRQIAGFCKTLKRIWAKMDEPAPDAFAGAATLAVILVLWAGFWL
ncbi:MAG: hypothetical protein FD163_2509 [Hyphomonadaceae bacterium]|nr:MAG: hypothetical protein FD128_1595 [Hyphomonadaceae bacterium]KAF0182719.1 MAG: hypothetical protein FD163_2509 [Hyphomonadaceae bacterium]